jgi:hypothetical protein
MSKSHLASLVFAIFSSGGVLADSAALTRLDVSRGYRWELHGSTVSLYAIGGDVIREVRLPGAIFSGSRDACPPDMLVAPRTGELIVASNANPRLWRVHPTRYELQVYDIELAADSDKDFGFAALAWGPSEKTLYALSAAGSGAWRIDLEAEAARPVTAAEMPAGGCRAR